MNSKRMAKLAGLLKEQVEDCAAQSLEEWIDEGPNSWGKWVPKAGPLDDRADSDELGGVFEEDEDEKDVSVYDALNSNEEDESKYCEVCGDEVEEPETSNLCSDCSDHPESRFIRGEEYDQELYEGTIPPPVPEKALKAGKSKNDSGLYGEPLQKGSKFSKDTLKANPGLVEEDMNEQIFNRERQREREEMAGGFSDEDFVDPDTTIDPPQYKNDVGTLGSIFSDTYKELHGIRPRHIDTSKMSAEELQDRIDDLRQQISDSPEDDYDDYEKYLDRDEDIFRDDESFGGSYSGRHRESPIKFESLKLIIRDIIRETRTIKGKKSK